MEEYTLSKEDFKTKAGWSPFEGRKVMGKVVNVTLHGKKIYEDGKLLVKKGEGRVISPLL
jgi:dihydroorotase-like cyclic amidohydrolase